MKFLLLGNMADLETGFYIYQSIIELGHECKYLDTREISNNNDMITGQKKIVQELEKLKSYEPDIVIVFKGLELTLDTVKKLKKIFSSAIVCNWFFDIYIYTEKIWEHTEFIDCIKEYDLFFCSLKGVANNLKQKGLTNIYHLMEACYPQCHERQYMNYYQERKYGNDISFCGSLGLTFIHKNRIKILEQIANLGYQLNIWGNVFGDIKYVPLVLRPILKKEYALNERHSMVCQSSLINLGLDAHPELELGFSARIFRVMCAGGLYLCKYVNNIESVFKINKDKGPITKDQDIVVFYDENRDLEPILDYLLENDDVRTEIAGNGWEKVMKYHKFTDRITQMIEIISSTKK